MCWLCAMDVIAGHYGITAAERGTVRPRRMANCARRAEMTRPATDLVAGNSNVDLMRPSRLVYPVYTVWR